MTYASELPDRQQEQDNKIEYGKGKTAIVGGLSPFHSFRRIFLNDFLVTAQFL